MERGYGLLGRQRLSTTSTVTDKANPSQAPLYQTQRFGNFQYQFAVPSGAYTVNLKFAEFWWTGAGQRIFNVAINGQPVLSNFDIFAAAGGALVAVDKAFAVTATSAITIQFTSVFDVASVNAIEILPASGQATVSVAPATATLTASQSQPFTATVTNATNPAVTWTLSPASGAGTISVSGNTATYTAPASIAVIQTVTLTATSVADIAKSASSQITLLPGSTFTAIRLNSGGGTFTDSATGNVWSADTGFSGGNAFSTTSTVTDKANPSQAPLYQTQRFGNFQYQFAVPSGAYTVNLKFAEFWWTGAGQRIFNVAINGQPVLSNFDIFAAAGGALVAVDKAFAVTTTSAITIQFTSVLDYASVNAIEILPASGQATVSVAPATATLTASQSQPFTATVTNTTNPAVTWTLSPASGAGTVSVSGNTATYTAPSSIAAGQTVTLTATSVADIAKSASSQITLLPGSTFTATRVHSGGGAFTDPATGNVWSADTGFSGGNAFSTTSTVTDKANPSQAPLYQTQRFGNFQYQFAVPSGAYTVNLKFAEFWWTGAGQRIFNVAINGQPVLSNFDVFAAAGGALVAVDKAFAVTATSAITIQFTSVLDFASVNAIEILPASGQATVSVAPATATLTASQSQPFTATVTNATNPAVTWTLSPASGAGTISVSGNAATYTAPASIAVSQTVTLTATSVADTTKRASSQIALSPPSTATAIRLNSGGGTFTDSATGNLWSADTGFSGGNAFSTTNTISDTANPSQAALYQTERYGNFSYTFAVLNGTYTVTLKFAELVWTSTGERVFNVAINGQTVLSNFDIVAAAGGPFIAIDRSFTVGPTTSITIQFTRVVDNAKVDAIQIQ